MITTQNRSQVDQLWTHFWTGGITNPLTVIEQTSYLMFLRMLDMTESRNEKLAARTGKSFRKVYDGPHDVRRWSSFKQLKGEEMFAAVRDRAFPHLKEVVGETSTFGRYFKDAQFLVPSATLLIKAVESIEALPLERSDAKGDLYEYLLGKLSTAGINGQFRTPRHIIAMMVELLQPKPTEFIGDPSCGTGGFLVAAMEWLRRTYTSEGGKVVIEGETVYTGDLLEPYRDHVQTDLLWGFDFDATMLRIAAMNLMLHGVDNPQIHYQDSLSHKFSDNFPKQRRDFFDVILANPPFKGNLDPSEVHPHLLRDLKTRKTELLFLALILSMLKNGGRSATIVPAGVLEGETGAHLALRRMLIDDNQLDAVISLPHWVFKPYASVATAILVFSKSGRTDRVWFYRVENDGFNDDATKSVSGRSDIPDLLARWKERDGPSYLAEPGKHGFVGSAELRDNDYTLTAARYLTQRSVPSGCRMRFLGDLFTIQKGSIGAAQSDGGEFPFVTSSEDLRRHSTWEFEGEAIGIPLVSSTGHGHASMKKIHYMNCRFAAASIVAVLTKKPGVELSVRFAYFYLLAHKDDILVPLMRGAANVSLSLDRIARVEIPVPESKERQAELIRELTQRFNDVDSLTSALVRARESATRELDRFRTVL